MRVPFLQINDYGCGHYCLANLFNDERFLMHIEDNTPSYIEDLNVSLRELMPGFWLHVIFCLQANMKLQNRLVDLSLFEIDFDGLDRHFIESSFRPFLMVIKIFDLHHLVLVIHRLKDNMFCVINSYNPDIDVLSPEAFVLKYYITEVIHFESNETKEACTNKSNFNVLLFTTNFFSHLKDTENEV